MGVVVSVEEVGPWRKQLTVEVPAPIVTEETDRVVRDLGRRVQIPGFRRGKVPASVVRQRFGRDIEREVLDRLLPRYWSEAKEEEGIEALAAPEVDEVGDLKTGEPLSFRATVEVRPEFEIASLDDFELPDPEVEVTAEELGEAIDDLRRRAGEWITADRAAARGDLVKAEITEIGAGEEEEPTGPAQEVEVELGDARVWEELTLALTGAAAGQTVRFTRAPETEGSDPRRFAAEVKEVRERELATLDDELARRVGNFDSVAALEQEVRRSLESGKRSERHRQREEALLAELRVRHPFSLPQGVVDHEVEHLLEDYARSLAARGVDLERAQVDWARLRGEIRPKAEQRVHSRLLLDGIVSREGIEIAPEELEGALAVLARAQGRPLPALRREMQEEGRLGGLEQQLRRDKLVRRLLGDEQEPEAAEPSAVP